MASLDLDARRKAHAGESHTVTVGGTEYQLPPALPLDIAVKLEAGDIAGGMEVLFGDAAADVLAAGLTEAELRVIFTELYGVDLPESSASPASSAGGGKR